MTGGNRETRLVIFDCDGTLVDSQHLIVAAMTGAFADCGLAVPGPLAVRRVVGLSLVEAVAALLPGTETELHTEVAGLYKARFQALRLAQMPEPLYPGAALALEALDEQGYLLGIATGKSRRGLRAVLERHGLAHYFTTLQTADDAPGKPHPGMVRQAMAAAGAEPAATLMVGDTSFDMGMAKAAGVAASGVAWGYHEPDELIASGACQVIGGYHELVPLVALLMPPGHAGHRREA